ncbi:hypothetical protein OIO90_003979 [Microbotryomycetes sp. JL221]|nr:hypothetical protein OIO90_003979 [Microbotryomycetes sp. JL221]
MCPNEAPKLHTVNRAFGHIGNPNALPGLKESIERTGFMTRLELVELLEKDLSLSQALAELLAVDGFRLYFGIETTLRAMLLNGLSFIAIPVISSSARHWSALEKTVAKFKLTRALDLALAELETGLENPFWAGPWQLDSTGALTGPEQPTVEQVRSNVVSIAKTFLSHTNTELQSFARALTKAAGSVDRPHKANFVYSGGEDDEVCGLLIIPSDLQADSSLLTAWLEIGDFVIKPVLSLASNIGLTDSAVSSLQRALVAANDLEGLVSRDRQLANRLAAVTLTLAPRLINESVTVASKRPDETVTINAPRSRELRSPAENQTAYPTWQLWARQTALLEILPSDPRGDETHLVAMDRHADAYHYRVDAPTDRLIVTEAVDTEAGNTNEFDPEQKAALERDERERLQHEIDQLRKDEKSKVEKEVRDWLKKEKEEIDKKMKDLLADERRKVMMRGLAWLKEEREKVDKRVQDWIDEEREDVNKKGQVWLEEEIEKVDKQAKDWLDDAKRKVEKQGQVWLKEEREKVVNQAKTWLEDAMTRARNEFEAEQTRAEATLDELDGSMAVLLKEMKDEIDIEMATLTESYSKDHEREMNFLADELAAAEIHYDLEKVRLEQEINNLGAEALEARNQLETIQQQAKTLEVNHRRHILELCCENVDRLVANGMSRVDPDRLATAPASNWQVAEDGTLEWPLLQMSASLSSPVERSAPVPLHEDEAYVEAPSDHLTRYDEYAVPTDRLEQDPESQLEARVAQTETNVRSLLSVIEILDQEIMNMKEQLGQAKIALTREQGKTATLEAQLRVSRAREEDEKQAHEETAKRLKETLADKNDWEARCNRHAAAQKEAEESEATYIAEHEQLAERYRQLITEHKTELEQLVQQTTKDRQELEKQLEAANSRATALQLENQQLQGQHKMLNDELGVKTRSQATIEAELGKAKSSLDDAVKQVKTLEQEVKMRMTVSEQLATEREKIDDDLMAAEQAKITMQTRQAQCGKNKRSEAARTQAKANNETMEELRNTLKEARDARDKAEADAAKAKTDLRTLQRSMDMTKNLQHSDAQMHKVEEANAKLNHEVKTLRAQVTALNQTRQKLEEDHKKWETKYWEKYAELNDLIAKGLEGDSDL